MADDMYEPTPSKRLRSYDGYSSSPSYSEISCHEELGYSLRRERKPLTPIKSKLRHVVTTDYIEVEDVKSLETSSTQIEKRITRSCNIENGMYFKLNPR